jgi:glutamate--cysteine ligase
MEWGLDLLRECTPFAQQLDEAHGVQSYAQALSAAQEALLHPHTLPSARVVDAIQSEFGGSFAAFAKDRSSNIRQAMLAHSLPDGAQQALADEVEQSWKLQSEIEASDTVPFDAYLQEYLSARRLVAVP